MVELSITSRALGGHPRPRADLLPWASGAETTVEYNCVNNITTGHKKSKRKQSEEATNAKKTERDNTRRIFGERDVRQDVTSDAELAAFLLDR